MIALNDGGGDDKQPENVTPMPGAAEPTPKMGLRAQARFWEEKAKQLAKIGNDLAIGRLHLLARVTALELAARRHMEGGVINNDEATARLVADRVVVLCGFSPAAVQEFAATAFQDLMQAQRGQILGPDGQPVTLSDGSKN
jgi:hypothetical protein